MSWLLKLINQWLDSRSPVLLAAVLIQQVENSAKVGTARRKSQGLVVTRLGRACALLQY